MSAITAWVTKEWMEDGKRRRKKVEPGLISVSQSDQFVVEWINPDGRRCRKKISASGKRAKRLADDLAEQTTAKLTLGTYEKSTHVKWYSFRKEIEHDVLPRKRPDTQRKYKDTMNFFEKLCKPKYVHSITTRTIDTFRSRYGLRRGRHAKSTVSPASVNAHLRHLKAVLRKAHKWGYLPTLPEIEFLEEPEKLPVYVTPDHFDMIYKKCEEARVPTGRLYSASDWWRALMVLGIMAGLRLREMLTLPWIDVHLDEGYLVIRHRRAKGKRDDIVPLHPVAVDHLRKITDYGTLVFEWPLTQKAVWEEWHRIQKLAGIDLPCEEEHEHTDSCHRYGFHALKKACGTLNAGRLPKPVLNAFMRHRSFATTERYYLNQEKLVEGVTGMMFVPEAAKRAAQDDNK